MPIRRAHLLTIKPTRRTEYWTVEAKVNSAFDGKFNFLLGANYANVSSER